jgi:hypothetical protein
VILFYIVQAVVLLTIAWLIGRVPQPQTLGLGAERREKIEDDEPRDGRNLGLLGELLFLPVLFLLAICSVPVTFVAAYFQRRRERAFFLEMSARNRVVSSTEFQRAAEELRGTVIEEWYSVSGPVRWWWTPENLYDESPEPIADSMVHSRFDESNRFLSEWIRHRYTQRDDGAALLIDKRAAAKGEVHAFWRVLESEAESINWIAVAPPERLRIPREKKQ